MKSTYIKEKKERRKVFFVFIGIEKREKDECNFFLFEINVWGELLELNLNFFSLCWIDFLLFVKHTINKVLKGCEKSGKVKGPIKYIVFYLILCIVFCSSFFKRFRYDQSFLRINGLI